MEPFLLEKSPPSDGDYPEVEEDQIFFIGEKGILLQSKTRNILVKFNLNI
jgi:hypothetical protein